MTAHSPSLATSSAPSDFCPGSCVQSVYMGLETDIAASTPTTLHPHPFPLYPDGTGTRSSEDNHRSVKLGSPGNRSVLADVHSHLILDDTHHHVAHNSHQAQGQQLGSVPSPIGYQAELVQGVSESEPPPPCLGDNDGDINSDRDNDNILKTDAVQSENCSKVRTNATPGADHSTGRYHDVINGYHLHHCIPRPPDSEAILNKNTDDWTSPSLAHPIPVTSTPTPTRSNTDLPLFLTTLLFPPGYVGTLPVSRPPQPLTKATARDSSSCDSSPLDIQQADDGAMTIPGGSADHSCGDVRHRQGQTPAAKSCPAEVTWPDRCAGCGGLIVERYYLQAADRLWHRHCLTCTDCHCRLDAQLTCFTRDSRLFCKADYYRRFSQKRCARCQQGISASELVMRARDQVFHVSCFSCSTCDRTLTPGQEFGLRDNLVYCRVHFELLLQDGPGMGISARHSPNQNGSVPFCHSVDCSPKGRSRKRKVPVTDSNGCTRLEWCVSTLESHSRYTTPIGLFTGDLDCLVGTERPGDVLDREVYGHPSTGARQKRVRTSFKHHQLRTMKTYFSLNHNPDAKDLRQLSQKTGLSKRVLQVWFQNARAKFRRSKLKQQLETVTAAARPATSPPGADNSDGQREGSSSLTDTLSASRSPAMSDISSAPSLSDMQTTSGDDMHCASSLTDLLSYSLTAIP